MNANPTAVSGGLLGAVLGATLGAFASPVGAEQTLIQIAGHEVPVLQGGLYDRYRSNPPLSVIAAEAPGVDLSWFKGLHKEKVDMGFESYSPNFYYQNSRVTVIFTADLARLRELMPAQVLAVVQPLQVWPGRGLVALTAYTYRHCDNDSYNEVGLSVVTNRPGGGNWGPLSLLGQSMDSDFWGYVLKLPVNTELARVRGVVGYNLPKWLTGIGYRETEQSVVVEILDSATGQVDVTLETKKLDHLSSQVALVSHGFTNLDAKGQLTTGHAVSRQLSHAATLSAEGVNLTLTEGSLSTYIQSLKLGRVLRHEYVPEFQSALYAPKPF